MQKTWRGKTAKQIIAACVGETRGGDFISKIGGRAARWNYHTHYNPDGTLQSFGYHTVCDSANADCIEMEDGTLVCYVPTG